MVLLCLHSNVENIYFGFKCKKYITNELEKRNIAAADCQSSIFRGCVKTICFIALSIMTISIKMMISCQLLKPLPVYERENSSRVFIIWLNDFLNGILMKLKRNNFRKNTHEISHNLNSHK